MPKQATKLLVTNPDGDGGGELVLPYGLQDSKPAQRLAVQSAGDPVPVILCQP